MAEQRNPMCCTEEIMKTLKLTLLGTLVLLSLSAATLSAQNTLPNPHDDNCWSSLTALRACQTQAYDQAQADAQRCTSYPEYQCFDYYQPPQKTAEQPAAKIDRNAQNATSGTTANQGL